VVTGNWKEGGFEVVRCIDVAGYQIRKWVLQML